MQKHKNKRIKTDFLYHTVLQAGGIQTVSVASHSTAVTAVNGLPATGGAIVAMLPAGVSFYAAVGYVPSIGQSDAIGTALADGRTALILLI